MHNIDILKFFILLTYLPHFIIGPTVGQEETMIAESETFHE